MEALQDDLPRTSSPPGFHREGEEDSKRGLKEDESELGHYIATELLHSSISQQEETKEDSTLLASNSQTVSKEVADWRFLLPMILYYFC